MGSENTFDTADATEDEIGNRRMIDVVNLKNLCLQPKLILYIV
jgi:hypothetical protein